MVQWNITAVVGVPGVGKTSLCRRVAKELGCTHVNYGELMLEVAMQEGIASTDSEMFSLDIDVQHHIWRAAAEKISGMRNVIVDLHGVDQSQLGYLLSLPIETIFPEIIVIIESSCSNIMKRRRSDSSKTRITEDVESLKAHMKFLRGSMAACSVILGCTLAVLQNNSFDDCLRELVDILGE
jgi:adenylate kinase